MRFLSLIILFTSISLQAKTSHLSCSSSGLHLAFINGVAVDLDQFKTFKLASLGLATEINQNSNLIDLSSSPEIEKVTVEAYHNTSFNLLYDGFETWKLYMQGQTNENGGFFSQDTISKIFNYKITQNSKAVSSICPTRLFKRHCDKLDEILFFTDANSDLGKMGDEMNRNIQRGRKILFVSHSAGALFVDAIRDSIRDIWGEEIYLYTSHLALARPLETLHKNQYHLTFEDDEVTEFLRLLPLVGFKVPRANLSKSEKCFNPNKPTDPTINHDYIFCYLGQNISKNIKDTPILNENEFMSARSHVKNAIYRAASYLQNNDDNCCEKQAEGKVWLNRDNTIGGFISKNTLIEGDYLVVKKGAQLCGTGSIDAKIDKVKFIDSRVLLKGSFEFGEIFSLTNVQSTKISKLVLPNEIDLRDSFIDGEFKLDNNLAVRNLDLVGNLHISRAGASPFPASNGILGLKARTPRTGKVQIKVGDALFVTNSEILQPVNISANTLNLANTVFFKSLELGSSVPMTLFFTNSQVKETLSIDSNGLQYFDNVIVEQASYVKSDSAQIFNSKLQGSFMHEENCPGSSSLSLRGIVLEGSNSFKGQIQIQSQNRIVSGNTFDTLGCSKIISISAINSDIVGFNLQGSASLAGTLGAGISVDATNGPDTAQDNIAAGTRFIGPISTRGGCDFSGTVQPGGYDCPVK